PRDRLGKSAQRHVAGGGEPSHASIGTGTRRRSGDARMDQPLRSRRRHAEVSDRHAAGPCQPAARSGHLVQRQEALVSRSAAAHPQPANARRTATIDDAMQGKLNLFQITMLHWRDLHPYNAVHVVVVEQRLEPERLKACVETELGSAGLTGLYLARRRRRFEYRGGAQAVAVTILPGADDARRAVDGEIERQLNLPFAPDGAISPFRFFAVDGAGAFHLGLVYDHFIAGGDSIALLLGRLVARYRAGAAAEVAAWTPRLYPRTYGALFRRHAGYLLRGLRRVPMLAASCRRSLRAPCRSQGDASNAFLSQGVDASEAAQLVRTAREWGVTRNDLFLALLLSALA